jgi:hypothetical protein
MSITVFSDIRTGTDEPCIPCFTDDARRSAFGDRALPLRFGTWLSPRLHAAAINRYTTAAMPISQASERAVA